MSVPDANSFSFVQRGSTHEGQTPASNTLRWSLPVGHLIELSGGKGSARTTLAGLFLRDAQQQGEPTAWIQRCDGRLYPPDFAALGIDLKSLVVIRLPSKSLRADRSRAADFLVRSGAFGSVFVDFCDGAPEGSSAWQGRLLALARKHHSRVFLLTRRRPEDPSFGSLISIRVHAELQTMKKKSLQEECSPQMVIPEILKNKLGLSLNLPSFWVRAF